MNQKAEDIYEQHAKTVYRYLFSLTSEADTAEELTQETFYQALKRMDTYRGESSPQVWLCAIAKRLWFKELERRRRTAFLPEESLAGMAAPDRVEEDYETRENRFALYRAIQQLDSDTREVIRLRLAGDFSFRDIGDILGQSEVWARVRFYRGKEALARMMGGDKDEGK
ncbi:MAG: RNA polymerase sigma factor [Oscillospiraceae bacterium]